MPQSSGAGPDKSDRASIESIIPTWGHLYVIDIMGGPSRVRVFDNKGEALPAPPLPPISAVYGNCSHWRWRRAVLHEYLPRARRPGIALTRQVGRRSARRCTKRRQSSSTTRKLCATSPPRKTARSSRSTSSAAKERSSTAHNPALLYGYGGYGISMTPYFLDHSHACGSIRAASMSIANIRGGGEYGEEWHKAGASRTSRTSSTTSSRCAAI